MKTKLFIIILIIISALIVLGDEVKTVYKDKATLFEFEEESTKDGYRWVLETTNPNMKVVSKNTVQKAKDGFDITFTKNGNYTLVFKYTKKNKEPKQTITQKVRVIEDVELNWYTDWNKVVQDAKKENKIILLLFTGSDWCGPCKSLEANIIMTKEFEKLAKDNFILYKADFPKHTEVEERLYRQNYNLYKKYSIKGYPTTIILDANEKEIGKIGGYNGEYINFLKKLLKEIKK